MCICWWMNCVNLFAITQQTIFQGKKNQIKINPLAKFRHGCNSICHYHMLLVNKEVN